MVLGQLATHPPQRSEGGPLPQLLIQMNLKEIKDLDVRVYSKTLRRDCRWSMTRHRERFLIYDSETTNNKRKKWAGLGEAQLESQQRQVDFCDLQTS